MVTDVLVVGLEVAQEQHLHLHPQQLQDPHLHQHHLQHHLLLHQDVHGMGIPVEVHAQLLVSHVS